MTCRRLAGAIACSRGAGRRVGQERPPCRWAGCPRKASKARWGCKVHYFKLPPGLRNRLYMADRAEPGGRAWQACADEADRWAQQKQVEPKRPSWRQPELPL